MIITLNIFLIAYFVALVGFVLFSSFNVYHAVRFGLASPINITVLIVFLVGAFSIIGIATPTIVSTNWGQILIGGGVGLEPPNS